MTQYDITPVPITVRQLKCYPYFVDWCQELGRPLEDVLSISIRSEIVEVPSDSEWAKFEPTDNYTAGMTFKDGSRVERPGKFSDGTMRYVLEEKEETK